LVTSSIAPHFAPLAPRRISNIPADRGEDYFFGPVPGGPGRASSIRIDDTILPGCELRETIIFAVCLRPASRTDDAILKEAEAMLSTLGLSLQLATETSPGELKDVAVGPLIPFEDVTPRLREWILA